MTFQLLLYILTFLAFLLAVVFYKMDAKLPIEQQNESWQFKVASVFTVLGLAVMTLALIVTIQNC